MPDGMDDMRLTAGRFHLPRFAWASLALGYMGLIFYISSIPGSVLERVPLSSWAADFMHVPLFGILAFLLLLGTAKNRAELRSSLRPYLLAALVAVLYGVLDEAHQSRVAGRVSTISDGLLDTLGAFIVLGLARWRFTRLPTGSSPPELRS